MTKEVILKDNGDTAFYQIPSFSLISTQNEVISSETLLGKTTVLSAFDLPCQDTCQLVLNQLNRVAQVQEAYPELSILSLVNTQKEEIPDLIRKNATTSQAWRVVEVPDSSFEYYRNEVFRWEENSPGQKTISSHNRFILVDRLGYIRGYYDAVDPEEFDRLMVEIKVLEYNRKVEK